MISNYITNADYNQTNFQMLVGVLSHKGRREFNTFGEVQMRLLHYHTKIQQQKKVPWTLELQRTNGGSSQI